jgi:hypothetical protein
VKTALEKRFQDFEGTKKNVTAELTAVLLENFHEYFIQILKRSKKCVEAKADFFAGTQNNILHISYVPVLIDRLKEIYCLIKTSQNFDL